MCKVSIILPTYNRKYCIARAIDSIFHQTYTDYELIIVDDGSTDGTDEYVNALSKKDGRIRYIRSTRNAGAAEARNIGIREAAGRYIAFQDSDTYWVETKLEKQVAYMDTADSMVAMVYSPYKRIYSDYSIIYPSLDIPIEKKSGNILQLLLENPLVDTPTMLVRKEVLNEIGGFDSEMRTLEDYELSIRIAKQYQIHIIDEVMLFSDNKEDSISNDASAYIKNSFYLLQKHKELFKQYDMTMIYLNQMSQYALQYQQLEMYMAYLQKLILGNVDN